MRDPALCDALQTLAVETATRFSALVAAGDEIPFDVAEEDGESGSFFSYVPLTARFIAERETEIRSLPSFDAACAALAASELAADYLEARGHPVPADPGERAAQMLVIFLSGLWEGSAEFALDRSRLAAALHALDAEMRDVEEADLLVAPVVGLRMPAARLELPSGVRVVRAETVEAPIEAMRSEGMNRAPWEPQFLAVAELPDGADRLGEAMGQLRDLISVMRLFKPGGVALGPYAFAPTGGDRWRRVATGTPAPRSGGYSLSEGECAELRSLARELEARPDPEGSLAWAVARFEMGCSREDPLDGLSDNLLALRSVLEGSGPLDASLPVRAGALLAEVGEREDAHFRIERAFALERSLMLGTRLEETGEDCESARELAGWIEDCTRSILRDGALGRLGDDLSAAADETLVATGLVAGEGESSQLGETAEWELAEGADVAEEPGAPGRGEAEAVWVDADPEAEMEAALDEGETGILEPVPEAADEIRISAGPATVPAPEAEPAQPQGTPPQEPFATPFAGEWFEDDEEAAPEEEDDMLDRDWLREVSRDATLEWPATRRGRSAERERIDTPRVRHLFPVPEDADWDVGELEYDRTRRARAG
ncbi:MAG: hypothetical protein U0R52_09285 [Solirubrobacterales bacterium]